VPQPGWDRGEPMAADQPTISVGTTGADLYVSVRGRATQRTCPTVDALVARYLISGGAQVTVELAGCDWVDSTFAGWLISLHKRLSGASGGGLRLAGCSARCRASLDKMHLCDMLSFSDEVRPGELREVPCPTSDRPDRECLKLMLKAHEELASLDEANRRVFGPIAALLRRQLGDAPHA
jgi:anti-anti-sigma regulatory factor